ncbi:hypothetical protein M752DRAFT_30550 [Aspergillus phoenicis ATCC 13157]|uniref:Uncharacterized protein n=1 Tax=Aspergillus phoenicis ATCC 13157 TaxID=1353007 RepID=A0A370PFR4_ASPPH|nr:hypothetical protein M752DRAFT_30550 [Aspergillus phoenicis ATCC 13157]
MSIFLWSLNLEQAMGYSNKEDEFANRFFDRRLRESIPQVTMFLAVSTIVPLIEFC